MCEREKKRGKKFIQEEVTEVYYDKMVVEGVCRFNYWLG